MNILMTGGTGFIGRALVNSLLKEGHKVTVLSRTPDSVNKIIGNKLTTLSNLDQLNSEHSFQVIINLAGAPIFDNHWSETRKKVIRDSRIKLTEQLLAYIERAGVKPELLISGSAIGYYGDQGNSVLNEASPVHPDFSQRLCADWESTAQQAERFGVRVCLIRTGLVLAYDGGLLQRMLRPFNLGLGGTLGNGQQWMSWIHRDDWISIAKTMINNQTMQGAYNATAPHPVTNSAFTKILAQHLKRPALLPLPAWLLKLLLGERSDLVLASQRVLPERLLAEGFSFQYPELLSALTEISTHHE
ncbi:MAG: TIGR01777 family oxidoreductase [Methylococcales bacterium]|nr:TIGR01777 family oxidoreductase [Methylococcales bacterium]